MYCAYLEKEGVQFTSRVHRHCFAHGRTDTAQQLILRSAYRTLRTHPWLLSTSAAVTRAPDTVALAQRGAVAPFCSVTTRGRVHRCFARIRGQVVQLLAREIVLTAACARHAEEREGSARKRRGAPRMRGPARARGARQPSSAAPRRAHGTRVRPHGRYPLRAVPGAHQRALGGVALRTDGAAARRCVR
jgi:hypothetical protein